MLIPDFPWFLHMYMCCSSGEPRQALSCNTGHDEHQVEGKVFLFGGKSMNILFFLLFPAAPVYTLCPEVISQQAVTPCTGSANASAKVRQCASTAVAAKIDRKRVCGTGSTLSCHRKDTFQRQAFAGAKPMVRCPCSQTRVDLP